MLADNKEGFIFHENAIVGFLDILGFKEIIKNEKQKKDFYENFFRNITDAVSKVSNAIKDIETIVTSDSIFIFPKQIPDPYNKEVFGIIVNIIKNLQYDFLVDGKLTRGSITSGSIYFNDKKNLLSGTALVNSLEFEKKAIHPRVIIDPIVCQEIFGEDLLRNVTDYNLKRFLPVEETHRMQNDYLFVNYLKKLQDAPPSSDSTVNDSNLNCIASSLKQLFVNHSKNSYVREKLLWLRDFAYLTIVTSPNVMASIRDQYPWDAFKNEMNKQPISVSGLTDPQKKFIKTLVNLI